MRFVLVVLSIFLSGWIFAQTELSSTSHDFYQQENAILLMEDLPDGIYSSHGDFVSKKPSDTNELILHSNDAGLKFNFYNAKTNKKIKKAFAVVRNGEVYFQTKVIVSNSTSDGKGLTWDGGAYFIKSEVVGRFLYMEDYLTPASAGVLGGLIASAATRQKRPIIFINHLGKFRTIKNFDHFKSFVDAKYPDFSELVASKEQMRSEADEKKLAPVAKELLSQIN